MAKSFWEVGFFMTPLAICMISTKSGLVGWKIMFSSALFFSTARMSDLVILMVSS